MGYPGTEGRSAFSPGGRWNPGAPPSCASSVRKFESVSRWSHRRVSKRSLTETTATFQALS